MKIVRAEAFLVDLEPEVVRFDAIQQFTKQETIFVQIETDDGFVGTGYSYTIGTGGHAVIAMLRVDLLPRLIGQDARQVEALWNKLFWATHGTAVGAITSLALAAVDTALWDIRCKAAGQPLWLLAGGYRERVPLYDTEGGWLNLPIDEIVAEAKNSVAKGWPGVKIKVGKPNPMEDVARLTAVREAIGPETDLMVDANQSFTFAEAKKRARLFEPLNLFWFEEPMPAEDMSGHVELLTFDQHPGRGGREHLLRQPFPGVSASGASASSKSMSRGSAASRPG
ncbi:MAG: mandelate racemase/muconate lactonizing enzyme family protein [Thermomicrobiales bacterium]